MPASEAGGPVLRDGPAPVSALVLASRLLFGHETSSIASAKPMQQDGGERNFTRAVWRSA